MPPVIRQFEVASVQQVCREVRQQVSLCGTDRQISSNGLGVLCFFYFGFFRSGFFRFRACFCYG